MKLETGQIKLLYNILFWIIRGEEIYWRIDEDGEEGKYLFDILNALEEELKTRGFTQEYINRIPYFKQ